VRWRGVLFVIVAACGRLGFGAQRGDAGSGGGPRDAALDGSIDAPPDAPPDASGVSGPMLVQQAGANWSSGATMLVPTGAVPMPTNDLIMVVGCNGDTVSTVTGAGVVWKQAVQSDVNRDVEIWFGLDIPVTGNDTKLLVTFTNNTVADAQASVMEWAGIAQANPLDGTASNNGSSSMDQDTGAVVPVSTTFVLVAGNRTTCAGEVFTGNSPGFIGLPSPDPCRYQAAYEIVTDGSGSDYMDDFAWNTPELFDAVIAAFQP
jgi:hypothetical protein